MTEEADQEGGEWEYGKNSNQRGKAGRAGDSGGGLSREFNLSYCHVASRPSAHGLIINCTCQASLSPL